MVVRGMMLVGLLLSLIGSGWTTGLVHAADQMSPHSISLGPGQATAGPGEYVQYTVTVRTLEDSFSGSVLVVVSDGLAVTGQPFCLSGCGQPSVEIGTDGTEIQASIDIYGDESASFSFQVMVDWDAAVGTSYGLSAYLLGGVNTAGTSETAFATLTVSDALPTSAPVDDRYAFLDVTPRLLRVAPGGSALYFIQPGFWGDWSANLPDYAVELQLPAGVSLATPPICGPRQSVVPEVSTCDVSTAKRADGSIQVTAHPEFVGVNTNGLYVTIAFDSSLPIDTLLQIDASLSVSGDVPDVARTHEQTLAALVVDPSEVPSFNEPGTISARYEVHSGYSAQGDSCSLSGMSSGYEHELSIYEWGEPNTALARMPLPNGRIGPASDGTSSGVCVFEFSFVNIPEHSVYMVASMAAGETVVCRACVLGLITPSQDAEHVLVMGW